MLDSGYHRTSTHERSVHGAHDARDQRMFRLAIPVFALGFRIILRSVMVAARVPSPLLVLYYYQLSV